MKKLIYLFIVFISLSCSKDSVEIIPNIKFNASINLDNPQYAGSNPFIIIKDDYNRFVGLNGVVVFEISPSEFYAFDRMCTHQHEKTGAFFVDFDNIGDVVLVCPECQSEFNVAAEYGSIIKGPAKWPLKRYQTSVSGNTLRIWN